MSTLPDPIVWADKAVGTYLRLLIVMALYIVLAVVAIALAFVMPAAATGAIAMLGLSAITLAVNLRLVLLRVRTLEHAVQRET